MSLESRKPAPPPATVFNRQYVLREIRFAVREFFWPITSTLGRLRDAGRAHARAGGDDRAV